MSAPLSYAQPDRKLRIVALSTFIGAVVGFLISQVCYAMLMGDGPIMPAIVAFAPQAMLWHWTLFGSDHFTPLLLIGGPILHAIYAAALASRARVVLGPLLLLIHGICFLVTLAAK